MALLLFGQEGGGVRGSPRSAANVRGDVTNSSSDVTVNARIPNFNMRGTIDQIQMFLCRQRLDLQGPVDFPMMLLSQDS